MAISEAVTRPFSDTASPFTDATSTSDDADAPTPARRAASLVVATLLMLSSFGALVYTQWWMPHEQGKVAQANHARCLEDVKVYEGKHSYAKRLAQCDKFLEN
jgi:hypothetical protein